jgi:hypothetical protein
MTSQLKRQLKRALIEERQKLKGAAGNLDDDKASSKKAD